MGKSSLGPILICEEAGAGLPPGEAGQIWSEAQPGRRISYLDDPAKTRAATHPTHANWFTVGDIGRLDAACYLSLTDRKDFTVISGGVNIYPRPDTLRRGRSDRVLALAKTLIDALK